MSMFRLLVTKKLTPEVIEYAKNKGIEVLTKELILIKYRNDAKTVAEVKNIADASATVVFTSKNAVSAVAAVSDIAKAEWKIFCLDGATRKESAKHFSELKIAGTANNARELASVVIESHIGGDVVFFCGNKRLEELPRILMDEGIIVKELVVYETESTPQKVSYAYDGVAFFSPSAVESFFSANTLNENAVCFSVGKTTSEAIRKFSSNTIITSDVAAEKHVIDMVMAYNNR